MTQTILSGLAGMMGIILFSCLVSFYQDIKTSLRHKAQKLKEKQWEREAWTLETNRIKNSMDNLIADAQRNDTYEVALSLYEEIQDIKEFNYPRHAHTPVL